MTYKYTCQECEITEQRVSTVAKRKKFIMCSECGRRMNRDLVAEHGRFNNTPGKWPMESDAAGVAVDQVDECAAYVRERGVPTEFNPKTGNPIFTSQMHRKRFCEVTHLYDRNAGFGDATPKHNMQKARAKCRR